MLKHETAFGDVWHVVFNIVAIFLIIILNRVNDHAVLLSKQRLRRIFV